MDISKLPNPSFEPNAVGFDNRNAYACAVASWLAYDQGNSLRERCRDFGMELVAILDKQPNYAVVLKSEDSLIIAFRGTKEKANWHTNLDARPAATSWGSVHKGFKNATDSFWPELGILTQRSISTQKSLWLAGHSLGGALATLATVRLLDEQGFSANGLYTFGQPPTGYFRFNRRLRNELKDHYFRIVNHRDAVVDMGALGGLNQHAGQLHYFDRSGKLRSKKTLAGDLIEAGVEVGSLLSNMVTLVRGNSKPYLNELTRPITSHSMAYYVRLLSKYVETKEE